jgi:hypothetical protein
MIYARVRVLTTIFTNNSNNKVKRVAARCEDLCRRDVCATGMNYSCGHIDIIDCPSVFALTRCTRTFARKNQTFIQSKS